MPSYVNAVQHKVASVRWVPSDTANISSRTLATGSWNALKNEIRFWNYDVANPTQPLKPSAARITHSGDVGDLQFLNSHILASCSDIGDVSIYEIPTEIHSSREKEDNFVFGSSPPSVKTLHKFEHIHNSPVTSIAFQPHTSTLVSCGEDGQLSVMDISTQSSKLFERSCQSSASTLRFCTPSTMAVSCGNGQIFVFDIRTDMNDPVLSSRVHSTSLTCLAVHPHRPELLATGSEDGVLQLWDTRRTPRLDRSGSAGSESTMRRGGFEVLSANVLHFGPIWELLFNPAEPTLIISCGEDQNVLETDFNTNNADPTKVTYEDERLGKKAISRLYRCTLPVNCLDFEQNSETLLVGSDAESIVLLNRVNQGDD
eukprot:176755_1